MPEPLAGLTVIDVSTNRAGATATQFLADAGAEVIFVEQPGGSPLRARADWPALGRGKRSVVLDLKNPGDRTSLDRLIQNADVLVNTFSPRAAQKLGFTATALGELNPRLVSVSITGWGTSGPWADIKGYEGLVMAKLGYFHVKHRMYARTGPSFISVPFATFAASQTALHGVMSALVERERSGCGQHVETDLVRAVNTLDTWNWYQELIGLRWPDAFQVVDAFNDRGELQAPLIYPLLTAPTKDGHWLQFAQTEPRLFKAMLEELGLGDVFTDPKWKGLPVLPTQELRTEFWEMMLTRVSQRTMAEWQETFERDPNVFAEMFRSGPAVAEHPQLVHDNRFSTLEDPRLGPVKQPTTLVHVDEHPLRPPALAPELNADFGILGDRLAPQTEPARDAPRSLPLEGITILDFGLMFAGPHGATLLTDLGARVIKVETLAGDTIRNVISFPESGAAKVMQGKESICVDLTQDDGVRIVHELVRNADVVLQCFRAGAAKRVRIDAESLKAINPDLIYVNAPGYGTGGPYGHRPAYAPSIGAAAGFALADAPAAAHGTTDIEDMKESAMRLYTATAAVPLQADGVAALGVASTILLGVLARKRGRALGELTATMLSTANHALVENVIDYPNRPAPPHVDNDGHGFGALYRLYEAADGWVFLAAPAIHEWAPLVSALGDHARIGDDPRFETAEGRNHHATELADELSKTFASRNASDWESELTAAGVGCVVAGTDSPQKVLMTYQAASEEYTETVESPIFDVHPRAGATVRFSRSITEVSGFCTAGQHTDAILAELGYAPEEIRQLHDSRIVGG